MYFVASDKGKTLRSIFSRIASPPPQFTDRSCHSSMMSEEMAHVVPARRHTRCRKRSLSLQLVSPHLLAYAEGNEKSRAISLRSLPNSKNIS